MADTKGKDAGLELNPPPEFLASRIKLWDEWKRAADEELAKKPREAIEVTLPDGSKKEATSYETTPLEIARGISKGLAERVVIAKVNGVLWDLERPFESSATLELLDFDNEEGRRVWWHSSAHILGECAERHYGCHLAIGPPTDDGFFYEMGMPGNQPVLPTDYPALEKLMKSAVSEKQKFERLVLTKEQLLEMFAYNEFKRHIIADKIPDGSSTTAYRCGPMIDLCVGPHIPHTGKVKAITVTKNSASYFLGDQNNASLQRIYGISFPDQKQMNEYKKALEEAAKRDHRKIGREQELFFFNDLSPGSGFWLPHGMRIYNTLTDTMRAEYRKRNYSEVKTPNMFNSKLWKTSGHWENYAEDMFQLSVDKEEFALKPMNCPGHCIMFGMRDRSYRELPLRYAEFGVLHRNEASGALSGLTRVRRFEQDDAHHFCTLEQVESEIAVCFDFLQHIYGLFGFKFELKLSTRPEKFIGQKENWDKAEDMLARALDKFVPGQWTVDPGDGAFYGPKIDVTIMDAMKRRHQCATIQLDFNLPERFQLQYRGEGGSEAEPTAHVARPVMIHRAILGSVERFMAILIEHFGGKWPFWVSPRQIIVVPVGPAQHDYAQEVRDILWDKGFYADVDLSSNSLPKKVRNGQIQQYNFILVVGNEELQSRSVNIRNRDDGAKGKAEMYSLDKTVQLFTSLRDEKRLANSLE